jgi:hypothetical protein
MKNILLFTVSLGSLFCDSLSKQTVNLSSVEEKIVSTDFDEEDYDHFLNLRVSQLLRKAKWLHSRCEFFAMENCYEEAAGLLEELAEEGTAYGHLCPYLIQGLCLNQCRKKDESRIKECFKKSYEIYLTHDFKVKNEFDYWVILQGLRQAQYAAYLAEDYEAFAQVLYKQMDLADPLSFTHYIYQMEDLQLLARQTFKADHWIFGKMQAQMEQKILKDIEMDVRLETIGSSGLLIDFYNPSSPQSVQDIVYRLEHSLVKP